MYNGTECEYPNGNIRDQGTVFNLTPVVELVILIYKIFVKQN